MMVFAFLMGLIFNGVIADAEFNNGAYTDFCGHVTAAAAKVDAKVDGKLGDLKGIDLTSCVHEEHVLDPDIALMSD